ncbi:MAG: helix-turn-helix domain-containing protein, partial [Desulfomonilaceae bacterium]
METYDHCWIYKCSDSGCAHEGVVNDGVLKYRASDGPIKCPLCGNAMERLREAESWEYDPEEQADQVVLAYAARNYPYVAVDFTIKMTDAGPVFSRLRLPEQEDKQAPRPEHTQSGGNFPDSDLIFTPEAARLLQTTIQQTCELARKGTIPALKMGKRWRYSKKLLLQWIEKESTRGLDLFSSPVTASSPTLQAAKK